MVCIFYHKQKSKEYIIRIRDEDVEADEYVIRPSNGNGETSNDNLKVWRCRMYFPPCLPFLWLYILSWICCWPSRSDIWAASLLSTPRWNHLHSSLWKHFALDCNFNFERTQVLTSNGFASVLRVLLNSCFSDDISEFKFWTIQSSLDAKIVRDFLWCGL